VDFHDFTDHADPPPKEHDDGPIHLPLMALDHLSQLLNRWINVTPDRIVDAVIDDLTEFKIRAADALAPAGTYVARMSLWEGQARLIAEDDGDSYFLDDEIEG
jgi:hypothetical protein